LLAATLLGAAAFAAPESIPMKVVPEGAVLQQPAARAETSVSFPGSCTFLVQPPTASWTNIAALAFDITWPADAPTNAQVLIHLRDWDFFWYQHLVPGFLKTGQVSHCQVDFSPTAQGWTAQGHHGTWNLRALMQPKEVGIRVFSDSRFSGTCQIGGVSGTPRIETAPPFIRNVRANTDKLPRFAKFELTFELPDRYPDPFDAEQVLVYADFKAPDGHTIRVDGFYGCSYYRQKSAAEESIVPQGPPYWRVRFCPVTNGVYQYTLHAQDTLGETNWGPASFEAVSTNALGFARVSKADPRFFEYDNGTYCFPIGQNIRSAFDTRMDEKFPWTQRWMEGPSAYERYFDQMQKHRENIVEIWSAAWSLGLEWTPRMPGYHGIGQFNTINAWMMDTVLDSAERTGVRINFVIHNHGKFGTLDDAEWDFNPLNVKNGGYLDRPEEYFSDPRALKSFRKLMRYIVARWGYSTQIFAWQLWSELDLTGSKHGNHMQPEVTDWHKLMGRSIRDMDPYDHLITTHVCGDYTHQNRAILQIPEIDFAAVDAYHDSGDPLHIVTLMNRTAEFNNAFGKPVMITEFGGSPFAASVKHLGETLHGGLWASTAVPLGGAPMFWWWQLIDEENFYPTFAAVGRFMAGEDRRAPDMLTTTPELLINDVPVQGLAVQCLKGADRAFGWIYRAAAFTTTDPTGSPEMTGVVLKLNNMAPGKFAIEFWDTIAGKAVAQISLRSRDGVLTVGVPAFARDIAFKVKLAK